MLSREVTTLNIEGSSIRLLTAKGNSVQRWAETPLEPGLVRDGLILDPRGVGTGIDGLFASRGVPKQRVMTCLTGLRAIPREITLPRIPTGQIEGAVRREARREMPLPLDDLYLSWQVLDQQGGQTRVYVLGVPRDLLDAQVEAIRAAGIKPHVMDLKPLALIRAVNEKEAIIADLEQHSLDVIIVVDDVPAIMRTIALGVESNEDKVRRLVEELRRTVKFHDDSHRERPLDPNTPIYLTGGLMTDTSVVEAIKVMSTRPVMIPTPPLTCPPDMPVPTFMVNIGLALK